MGDFIENPFFKSINWSDEQQRVIDSKGSIVVKGAAGTGKTLLVLYLALKFILEEKSVAIIVFTKSLRTYISDFFERNKTQDKIKVFYHYEWFRSNSKKFDVILLDEFQDFSFEDIELVIDNVRERILLFGDDEQKLYNKSIFSEKKTTTFIELCKRTKFNNIVLFRNFRIPKQIVSLINSIYRGNSDMFDDVIGSSFKDVVVNSYRKKTINSFVHNSSKAKLYHLNSHIEQLDWLTVFINRNKHHKNIGVLFKQNDTRYNGYFYDKKLKPERIPGIIETFNYLNEKGISVGYKYKDQDCLSFRGEININLMTVHSSKGLEFDCVILPFYSWTNRNHNYDIPYVSFTRCKDELIIWYC